MGLLDALKQTPSTADAMQQPKRNCRAVVVGAGPAGLLAAINLLRRSSDEVEYHVTLVETGEDYGVLDAAGLEKKRSWMIGLSTHGLTALRAVPGLYEDYVSQVGVPIESTAIYLGKTMIEAGAEDVGENYVVDRNFIVAALARYLNDNFRRSGRLTLRYQSKVLFVDPDEKRIFLRRVARRAEEEYLPYDLLIGADGVRSAVRAALVANERAFECSVADIFTNFKSVHLPLPAAVAEKKVVVLPQCLKGINGIGLPETGGKINLAFGYMLDTPCDEALHSQDAEVVAAYFKAHFKPFELDWAEVARVWVGQPWSQTGQVHCSFYHSLKLQLLILGDAAHATSPSIGQGMNTALADAAALDALMDAAADDLQAVLPAFSEERVKEGNALTEVAFHAYSMSPHQQLLVTLSQLLRGALSKRVPFGLVAPDPLTEVGKGAKLSHAYDELTRIGRLPAVRAVNEAARRRHFELRTGMVKPRPSALPALRRAGCAFAGLLAGVVAFAATQVVSKPLMDPAVEACSDPAKFAASKLHPYEPALGGGFVCIITQFLHALAAEPAGVLAWGLTIGLALPATVLWNAESGRGGAKGLVRYPTALGLLGQLLGISVVFPALWLPAAAYGKGSGAVRPARAYASIALAAPFLSLSVALFALEPASRAWTVCAGLLGGPGVALLPLLLSLIPAPAAEQAAAGARALSRAYAAAAALAFVGYTANLCLAGLAFGSPRAAVGALWAEAPPAVAFMSIDAGVLFLGLLLHLASTSPAEALAALLASPLVGPGAACALMLSRREARLGEAAAGEAAGAGETKKLA
mmetsp:Transcript_14538/g.42599  ORF Transcript_14538/g.42599 Transcript_14538/m.42599 type:complete len:810 (+) Transcript_14538:54-2483(+)